MANTSVRPITVDGVRLDTLGYNVTMVNMSTAARRDLSVPVPYTDGVIPSTFDAVDPAMFGLQMWVRGTDVDGVVPGTGQLTQMRANLDELLHLFGKRHALLDVQEQVDGSGTLRRAWCKVTDVMSPVLNDVGSTAQFSVNLQVVYGTWEDIATQDWVGTLGAASGTSQEVTTLQGGTDRSSDSIILVSTANRIVNPRITDVNTGAWVQLTGNVDAPTIGTLAGVWRINVATWESVIAVTSITLGTTAGLLDVTSVTSFGGTKVGGGPYLPVTPVRDTGLRRVKLALSGTFTGNSQLSVRSKRHYAI